MMEWQPIETAPKDGRDILIGRWIGDRWYVTVCHWNQWREGHDNRPSAMGLWYVTGGGGKSQTIPNSHWMPLPDAPA